MFESGIRGGITQSVHKWANANNPYMGCEYDPLRPTNYLNTWTLIIYMVGQCHNHYPLDSLNGLTLRT